MFYTYESGGKVSRPVLDYRTEVLSGSFAARGLESFKFNQGPAVPLSDIGGTLAQYSDRSIYNLVSHRSGLGILSGAQTSQQDVPDGYVLHQAGPIYTWTTDELGGNHDHNRILRPAPSRFLVFNNAEESKSYSYHPAIIDVYEEVNYGLITANATTVSNNGLVADLNATQVEYGRIIHVGNLESFGFNKTLNAASWKATSAWVGEGSLISFGRQTSPAVYGYITDGKVRLSGTADVDYSPATDGRGILPLQGDSVIGFAAGITGSGTLKKFTGTSESITVNPDEKQMLFSFLGVVIEKDVNVYNGSGSIKNLSTVEIDKSYAWNGSGTITIESDKPDHYQLKDIAHWVLEDIKSRPLASIKYELSDEKHTEDYNESAIDRFTERDYGLIIDPSLLNCVPASGTINTNTVAPSGCIKVDAELALNATYSIPPAITTPSTSIDWGDITTIASLQQDWGELLVTSDLMPFGGIKIDPNVGAADKFLPSWTSRGYIGRLYGEARVPLDVGVRGTGAFRFLGASKTNFSLLQPADGLFRVVSDSQIGFSAGITGTGTLRKFAGSAQSLTVNPEERQLLFSFVGERNSETISTIEIGQGNLFNFSNFVERTTFDYVGQGTITLESRKPDQFTLEELAKRTLIELRNVNLGDLRYEPSDEKHTEDYNSSAFVPSIDLDYGLLINPATYACVDTNGNITVSTVAATGCTKVAPGQTLSLANGVTYTVPQQIATPTTTIDYGLVSEIHSPTDDYGWILGTHAHGIPYGMFDIIGTAETPRAFRHIPDVVGSGLFKITGEALLPLFASVLGTGLFKPQGASITNFSLRAFGGGQIPGMYGESSYSFQVEHVGDGSLRKLGGSAYSTTYNPEERQLLFSFTGERIAESKSIREIGSGRIKNLATRESEKNTYDYVGSGSILTWNKLEEARAVAYNCSSIVPFPDIDYGFIVDPSTYVCVDASGNITTSQVAASGCIKTTPGQTLSIAPGVTYTVPSQTTVPTDSESYGSISDPADEPRDYEWILGTVAMGQPACINGTLEVRGTAASTFQPNWNSEGTVKIGNAAITNIVPIIIGSGTLFTFSGSSETLSAAVAGGGLFNIGGDPGIAFSPGVIGEGRFSTFSGAAESLTFNPEEKQMLFSFIGTSGDPGLTLAYQGEGVLFAIAGSGEREANAYYGSGTLKLRTRIPEPTEPANEKHTEVYDLNACIDPEELDYGLLVDPATYVCVDSSGNITASTIAASGCIKAAPGNTISVAPGVTYTVPSFITTVTDSHEYGFISDPPDLVLDYGWILDDTGKECPFGPIGVIRGTSGDPIRTFSEVFTGESAHWAGHGITITGDAEIVVPPQWDSPAEPPVKVYGAGKPNFSLRTFGGGNLWSMGGSSEAVRYSPQEEQVLFKFVPGPFSRWTTYDWQPSWVTKGFIKGAIGEAKTHWVPHIIGSGTLRKFTGTSESITVNPEERQLLFSFTGEHQVSFTANPPEDTARVKIGSLADTRFIPKYPGEGQIITSGIAKTHWVPHVIGTGTFRKFAGAAESLTFNPEEKQMLFSFVGERLSEKKSVTEIGSGNILVTGLSRQVLTFAEQPFGRIPVSGIGHTTRTRPYIGSGFLRKLGGSAESATFNPEEKQLLFSFTGERISEKTTVSTVGSGTLFGFSGASVITAAAYESQGLYRISGEGIIGFSLTHFGSGTLRKFAGAAESLTVNPDERQLLFSFTGEGSESLGVAETKQIEVDIDGSGSFLRAFAHEGSGTFRLSDTAGIRWVPNNIGSGTIFTLEGAAESLTFNPEEKQMLFSFTGEHQVSFTANPPDITTDIRYSGTSGDPLLTFAEQGEGTIPLSGEAYILISLQHFGSGSLYTINGAAESATFNPEERQLLFSVLGESTDKISLSHIGSGSLRKLGGSAEAVAFNPEEKQLLFSFNGAGSQSTTTREIGQGRLSTTGEAGVLVRFAHTGEGTIPLSGTATITRTRDFVGFGFIPVLQGAAESLTFNPTERDMLFSFVGERISEKITARELSKGGTLVVGSTSGDPLLTFAEQPQIEVAISGDSYDLRAFAYQGSGRLSNVNNLDEAFALAPYIGSGTVSIVGNAFVQVQLFQPPHAQVWII